MVTSPSFFFFSPPTRSLGPPIASSRYSILDRAQKLRFPAPSRHPPVLCALQNIHYACHTRTPVHAVPATALATAMAMGTVQMLRKRVLATMDGDRRRMCQSIRHRTAACECVLQGQRGWMFLLQQTLLTRRPNAPTPAIVIGLRASVHALRSTRGTHASVSSVQTLVADTGHARP